jgi:hypothetical protein
MKKSLINNNVRFTLADSSPKDILNIRKSNMQITHVYWVTLKVKKDTYLNEIYNPRSLILLFLN